jgi:hypothetical protein
VKSPPKSSGIEKKSPASRKKPQKRRETDAFLQQHPPWSRKISAVRFCVTKNGVLAIRYVLKMTADTEKTRKRILSLPVSEPVFVFFSPEFSGIPRNLEKIAKIFLDFRKSYGMMVGCA